MSEHLGPKCNPKFPGQSRDSDSTQKEANQRHTGELGTMYMPFGGAVMSNKSLSNLTLYPKNVLEGGKPGFLPVPQGMVSEILAGVVASRY